MADPSANDSSEIVKEQSESVAATNLKVLGDGPAQAMSAIYQGSAQAQIRAEQTANLAQQNAVSNAARMDTIANATVTAAVDKLLNVDPMEAVGVNKVMTGNDAAAQIMALLAALQGGGIGAKTMGNVPPVTP